jgi:hypothetical protein
MVRCRVQWWEEEEEEEGDGLPALRFLGYR